jgi:hypothetical protein
MVPGAQTSIGITTILARVKNFNVEEIIMVTGSGDGNPIRKGTGAFSMMTEPSLPTFFECCL